jgi:hypothetical protein
MRLDLRSRPEADTKANFHFFKINHDVSELPSVFLQH